MAGRRHYAVHLLYAGEDVVCRQQVVATVEGRCVEHYPLTEELPFTEWIGGVAVLSGWEEADCLLPASFDDVVHWLLGKSGTHVWHIEASDYAGGTVLRLKCLP